MPAIALLCLTASCDRQAGPAGAPGRYGFGHPAPPTMIAAEDIAIPPNGHGLPPGSGTAAVGAPLFAQQCASCHGANGEGTPLGVKLIGRDPRAGFPFGRDPKLVKTIGNYWPYATTLFDYVRRAMPLSAPGSLNDAQVYALTAYLLARNEVIPDSMVVDAATLPRIRMPARDRFVVDDRTGGGNFR